MTAQRRDVIRPFRCSLRSDYLDDEHHELPGAISSSRLPFLTVAVCATFRVYSGSRVKMEEGQKASKSLLARTDHHPQRTWRALLLLLVPQHRTWRQEARRTETHLEHPIEGFLSSFSCTSSRIVLQKAGLICSATLSRCARHRSCSVSLPRRTSTRSWSSHRSIIAKA